MEFSSIKGEEWSHFYKTVLAHDGAGMDSICIASKAVDSLYLSIQLARFSKRYNSHDMPSGFPFLQRSKK
jgi:hypothetical protein